MKVLFLLPLKGLVWMKAVLQKKKTAETHIDQ